MRPSSKEYYNIMYKCNLSSWMWWYKGIHQNENNNTLYIYIIMDVIIINNEQFCKNNVIVVKSQLCEIRMNSSLIINIIIHTHIYI